MVLKSKSLSESQRDIWMKVMVKEFISSEESGEDEIEPGKNIPVLMVKPLRWRAAKVDRFFKKMDKKIEKTKSKQAKQQTMPRVIGRYSTRPKPVGFADDFFGFTAA